MPSNLEALVSGKPKRSALESLVSSKPKRTPTPYADTRGTVEDLTRRTHDFRQGTIDAALENQPAWMTSVTDARAKEKPVKKNVPKGRKPIPYRKGNPTAKDYAGAVGEGLQTGLRSAAQGAVDLARPALILANKASGGAIPPPPELEGVDPVSRAVGYWAPQLPMFGAGGIPSLAAKAEPLIAGLSPLARMAARTGIVGTEAVLGNAALSAPEMLAGMTPQEWAQQQVKSLPFTLGLGAVGGMAPEAMALRNAAQAKKSRYVMHNKIGEVFEVTGVSKNGKQIDLVELGTGRRITDNPFNVTAVPEQQVAAMMENGSRELSRPNRGGLLPHGVTVAKDSKNVTVDMPGADNPAYKMNANEQSMYDDATPDQRAIVDATNSELAAIGKTREQIASEIEKHPDVKNQLIAEVQEKFGADAFSSRQAEADAYLIKRATEIINEAEPIPAPATTEPQIAAKSSESNGGAAAEAVGAAVPPVVEPATRTIDDLPEGATGARKAITEPERAARGLNPVEMQEYKTYSTAYEQGKKSVEAGNADPRTIAAEVAEKPRVLRPDETGALVFDRQRLRNQLKEAYAEADNALSAGDTAAHQAAKDKVNSFLDSLDRNDQALKRGGREASAALSAFQIVVKEDYSLESLLQRKRVSKGGKLTDAEQSKIVELQSKLEDTTAALDRYRADSAKVVKSLNPDSPSYGSTNRIVSQARKAEIEARLKEKFAQVGAVPDITAVAELAELMVYHLEASTKWTYSALRTYLKEKYPTLSDEDIEAAFDKAQTDSRLNGTPTKKTGKAMTAEKKLMLAKRRMEADLKRVNEAIEAVKQGKPVPKSSKIPYDAEAKALLVELQGARQKLKSMMPEKVKAKKQATEAKKVDAYKNRIEKRIEQLQAAIRTGKPIGKPKQLKLTAEIEKLRERAKQVQVQYDTKYPKPAKQPISDVQRLESTKKRMQSKIEELNGAIIKGEPLPGKRPKVQYDREATDLQYKVHQLRTELDSIVKPKPKTSLISEGAGVLRTLKTVADYSAPFRQGALLSIGEPRAFLRSFKRMFGVSFSEKKYWQLNESIKNHPQAAIAEQSGLYLAPDNMASTLASREEAFVSRVLHKIPGFGKITRGSERAYNGFLNSLRAEVFFKYADAMPDAKPETLKGIATFVNQATGRGTLGSFEKAAIPLADVFFSPRFVASRFQVWGNLASRDATVRKIAAKNLVGYVGAYMMTLKMAELAGAEVEYDPRSSDFGKIKINDTRIDMSAGMIPLIRYTAQIISGQSKTGGSVKDVNRLAVGGRFLRSKLSPAAGLTASILSGKNFVGDEYSTANLPEMAYNELTPMVIQDIREVAKNDGWMMAGPTGLISIFGGSVSSYKPKSDSPARSRRR